MCNRRNPLFAHLLLLNPNPNPNQLAYPFGNTPNNNMMIEKSLLVLTSAMREKVESNKMQYVILDVIYSTLVLCAIQEIFPFRQ